MKSAQIILPLLFVGCAVDTRFDYVPEGAAYDGATPGVVAGTGGTEQGVEPGGTGEGNFVGGVDTSTGGLGSVDSPGVGGGQTSSGGTVQQPMLPEEIFSGVGVSIPAGSNTTGVAASFIILEDSVFNGSVVSDGLIHTDLDPVTGGGGEPSSFDDSTVQPCVSGTVAAVYTSSGTTCDRQAVGTSSACAWGTFWGGGIALDFSSLGASGWNASAAGVSGFTFTTTGSIGGARLRVRLIDSNGAVFCSELTPGAQSVSFSSLQKNCWAPEAGSPNLAGIKSIEWQVTPDANLARDVSSFCVSKMGLF